VVGSNEVDSESFSYLFFLSVSKLKSICMFMSERASERAGFCSLFACALLWPEVTTDGLRDKKINIVMFAIRA
jgi:hypothetical protein